MDQNLKCCNVQPCTCPNVNCSRHGRCCECVAHHRAKGQAPNCYKQAGIILVRAENTETEAAK